MRIKLKFVLPIGQIVLVLGLLRWSYLWSRAAGRICDMPGPDPAWKLAFSVNGPVFLARLFWSALRPSSVEFDPFIFFVVDVAMLIVAVGLFWYFVSLNIYSWRSRRTVFMFSRVPLRLLGDALLITAGVILGCWGLTQGHDLVQTRAFPPGMGCFADRWVRRCILAAGDDLALTSPPFSANWRDARALTPMPGTPHFQSTELEKPGIPLRLLFP